MSLVRRRQFARFSLETARTHVPVPFQCMYFQNSFSATLKTVCVIGLDVQVSGTNVCCCIFRPVQHSIIVNNILLYHVEHTILCGRMTHVSVVNVNYV
jgi:hypothetical protein